MSRKLKVKIAALVLVAAASMAVMGVLLSTMQTDLSLDGYTQEMRQEGAALPDVLAEADEDVRQNTDAYDAIFQSKAQSIAFMANNDAGFEATDAKMMEYKDLLGVDNVLVVDRDGAVVASAQDTKANFAYARFNQLRTVFDDGEPSQAVEVEVPEQDSSRILPSCASSSKSPVPRKARSRTSPSASTASCSPCRPPTTW